MNTPDEEETLTTQEIWKRQEEELRRLYPDYDEVCRVHREVSRLMMEHSQQRILAELFYKSLTEKPE